MMRGRGQPIPVGSPVKRMMSSPVRSPIRPLTPLKRMGGVLSNPMGVKRPRLPASPYMNHNMQGALNPARLDPVARLCRVCGQDSSVIFSLREKPEMVTRLKRILNLVLDLEADKEAGVTPPLMSPGLVSPFPPGIQPPGVVDPRQLLHLLARKVRQLFADIPSPGKTMLLIKLCILFLLIREY